MQQYCVSALSMSSLNISGISFIIPEQTEKPTSIEPDAPQTHDPSIYSFHPLLHPFLAAMGLVVMVTVSLASLSPDCDLCCHEKKRFMVYAVYTSTDTHQHTLFIDPQWSTHRDSHSYVCWS